MSWSRNDHDEYILRIEHMAAHCTWKDMKRLYLEMLDKGCSYEELLRIDHFHNRPLSAV